MPDDTMIDRYLHVRARAEKNGDVSLVKECDSHLARAGYRPDASPAALEQVGARLESDVHPSRGRPLVHRDA